MSVVLISGAGSGIGRFAAQALMDAGHHVFAGIREIDGRNAERVADLKAYADKTGGTGEAVELDILSDESVAKAVDHVIASAGSIDVVVHNAAHLFIGVTEAFTPEQFLRSFDTNAVGAVRLNRAVLPHMRRAEAGYLLWVGSGTTRIVPPFIGPYTAAKVAMDAIAEATSFDVRPYGIDTTIVMPGPFLKGTEHFPKSESPEDDVTAKAYDRIAKDIARNADDTTGLIAPGVDADPSAVGTEIARLVGLPAGQRPFRTEVDFSDYGDRAVTAVAEAMKRRNMERMHLAHLLPATQL